MLKTFLKLTNAPEMVSTSLQVLHKNQLSPFWTVPTSVKFEWHFYGRIKCVQLKMKQWMLLKCCFWDTMYIQFVQMLQNGTRFPSHQFYILNIKMCAILIQVDWNITCWVELASLRFNACHCGAYKYKFISLIRIVFHSPLYAS